MINRHGAIDLGSPVRVINIFFIMMRISPSYLQACVENFPIPNQPHHMYS